MATMRCAWCGTENEPAQTSCVSCGTALGPPQRSVEASAPAQTDPGSGWAATSSAPAPAFPAAPSTYGGGDSFAAGLTFALGAGYGIAESLRLAARCGACCVAGRGPYQGQLTSADTH